MEIGGLQKLTLIDYPGRLAATVFLIGCDFRCPWCYSSELILPKKIKKQPKISQKELFKFLKERKKYPKILFLFVGRFDREKGILEMLDVFKNIKEENWGLIMAGDGPLFSEIKDFSKKYILADRIWLPGFK